MAIRKPSVAGTFYPADKLGLQTFCEDHLERTESAIEAKAVILPHAGYIYSGRTACKVLSQVKVPDTVFLLGPNHQAIGSPFALHVEGEWQTPLGNTSINTPLAEALNQGCSKILDDEYAHQFEHSLEVEVPLLQFLNPNVSIAPLAVGTLDLVVARQVAENCGEVLAQYPKPFLPVISTDMNHYEDDELTRKKDKYALDAIVNLDEKALAQAVKNHRISMCGFVPVYMLLVMKKHLNLNKARLVEYTTSASTSGDYDRVVGYAGFIFE